MNNIKPIKRISVREFIQNNDRIDVEDKNGEKAQWSFENNTAINRLDNGRRLYYIDPNKEYYINIYNQDDYITLDLDNIKHVELD